MPSPDVRQSSSPQDGVSSSQSELSASLSGLQPSAQQNPKRTRVLLSCATCRASKLKCDRDKPCGQCLKKGKPDGCVYAPRSEKHGKPSKSMAARLKRLEGMVRGMIDTDNPANNNGHATAAEAPLLAQAGSVVRGERATNYVGGTHFMAVLEDLEDLKNYFEDRDDEEIYADDPYQNATPGAPEILLFSKGVPRNKEEMLALLPERGVMDRLMNRYFNSNSPSQHTTHIPTFTKQYNAFLKDPQQADLHWVAALFMVLALGVFCSMFQAPHELENDTPRMEPMERFRQFRGACGWALVWGKYSQPGPFTLQAFLMYVEGDFAANRVSQMNCYLLSSTLIRLMLKLGLHRDPSKLPNISAYDGEMRRRQWNMAIQMDLLVSFHLGLPCMIHGIESDTALPRNLIDSDFDEDTKELPFARPMNDYTPLTYPICKASIARVFGLAARLSHSLTVPTYAEVMKVDAKLEEVYGGVPAFMRVKRIEESITDPPTQVIQRFGLASLYQKSRCVLHRRYLVEANPRREHGYSRRACLEAAVALLDYQDSLDESCRPGGMLSQNGWFVSSLAINDFLLADMVVALVLRSSNYSEAGGDFDGATQGMPLPSKEELFQILRRSYAIWQNMAARVTECRKAAEVVKIMLGKISTELGFEDGDQADEGMDISTSDYDLAGLKLDKSNSSKRRDIPSMAGIGRDGAWTGAYPYPPAATTNSGDLPTGPGFEGPSTHDFAGYGMVNVDGLLPTDGRHHEYRETAAGEPNSITYANSLMDLSADPWGGLQEEYDWNHFDAMTRGPVDAVETGPQTSSEDAAWRQQGLDGNPLNDFSNFLVASNSWRSVP